LPEIHAEVLTLHVVLGFTVDETALTLNVPVNTVRSRLRRGLASLRDTLQERLPALEVLQEEA
jgi:DNA-directed RNA polymerase specialized sigma24 family protein